MGAKKGKPTKEKKLCTQNPHDGQNPNPGDTLTVSISQGECTKTTEKEEKSPRRTKKKRNSLPQGLEAKKSLFSELVAFLKRTEQRTGNLSPIAIIVSIEIGPLQKAEGRKNKNQGFWGHEKKDPRRKQTLAKDGGKAQREKKKTSEKEKALRDVLN